MGLDVPEAEVDKLFDEFDADGGGEIGLAEMNKLLRRTVPPAERPGSAGSATPGGWGKLAGAGQGGFAGVVGKARRRGSVMTPK